MRTVEIKLYDPQEVLDIAKGETDKYQKIKDLVGSYLEWLPSKRQEVDDALKDLTLITTPVANRMAFEIVYDISRFDPANHHSGD